MRLLQLIKPLSTFSSACPIADFGVKGVSCDSKSVKPGFVFVAVKGQRIDGSEFIGEAVSRGAKAVITCSRAAGPYAGVSVIRVPDTRKAMAAIASEFCGHPSRKLKVTGVTGTNGKTTITYLIEAIVKEYGRRCNARPAVIGTVNNRYGSTVIASKNTTPGPLELQRLLQRMARAKVTHAAMEVSSHALDQERTAGIEFASAIFTNLTQDHLDYHKDLGAYFNAKARLFAGLSDAAFALVNSDDPYGRKLRGLSRGRVYTYGIGRPADFRAEDIGMSVAGSRFTLVGDGGRIAVKTRLIGRHNIYNILAAAGWALVEGIPPGIIRRAIAGCALVPGRLQKIEGAGAFSVFVDYAHTEDALQNVITAIRQVNRGRIIVVFGCGGDRDTTKRPKMGRVVSALADYAVITNDNPRSEDPGRIIADILAGVSGTAYRVVPDRLQAIRCALSVAGKGDVVLVAGKGHEDYQIMGDTVLRFDDREAVRKCLRSMR